jgi:feruloyl esterase
MKNLLLAAFAGAFVLATAVAAQTDHAECSHLVMLRLPDVKISEAVSVAAATSGPIRAAHCRVSGVIGTEIKFSLLLPDSWNRKFVMGGGGGFVGSVQNSAAASVNAGYATSGTDTGHTGIGTDASWAYNNLERQVNFGYLAVHRTAEVSKAIISGYYGASAARNYFSGCSRGGGQALMEAQRFPDDFDGVIAGAPAYDWTGIAAQMIHNAQAAFPDPRTMMSPLFSEADLKMIEAKILDACDTLDGVKDGVMEDPRRCKFDVNTLPLTERQRTALKALYEPVKNREGEIYPGQPFGGEGQPAGWSAWIVGPNPQLAALKQPSLRFAFGTGIFKYLVFNNPDWDYSTYEFANWKKDTAVAATFLNATNPNIDAFKAKGHKLILWHGWADPALTPLASIRYQDQVRAHDAKSDEYFRMFLLPGVLHCGGGAGPDAVDWTAVMDAWVEKGTAPDRVVARKMANGGVVRSRPLCVYPQHAEYKGAGSTDDEASFVCK